MKRLLIVTYYWPPSSGSGVQRWLKFAKYLPRMGWQPVVYTPKNPQFHLRDASLLNNIPDACQVIKRPIWEPYALYRKLTRKGDDNTGTAPRGLLAPLISWVRGTFFIPDPRRFWVGPSFRFLARYLEDHPVDALVTTGPPHSMHLIGLALKRNRPALPWLADMRDPWSTFDLHASFMSEGSRRKNRALEEAVVQAADRVILTSPGALYEFPSAPAQAVEIINNGFDREDLPPPAPTDPEVFRLVHSGLLNAVRDVPGLWRALARRVSEDQAFARALRLELVGRVDPGIARRLNEDPVLGPRVTIHGWMSHTEVLDRNRRASAFLVVVNQSENARSQLPGKIYEHLALQKPILAVCPEDSALADLIRETEGGLFASAENDPALDNALDRLWEGHRSGRPLCPRPEAVARFSREALTGKLVQVLDGLTTK